MPADRHTPRWMLGVGALLGGVALLVVLLSSGERGHRLTVTVPEARYMIPGSQIRAAGQVVGRVAESESTRTGAARLVLELNDDRVWPVPRGTTFEMRWSGSITYTGRYVDLQLPADPTRGTYAEGASIAADDVITRVEADDLLRTFGGDGRRDLRAMLDRSGAAFDEAGNELRGVIAGTPPALAEARAVLDDLGSDTAALDTLVRSGDAVVHAVRVSDPGVGALVQDAATTFAASAAEADGIERGLSQAHGTLASARRTLGRAQSTLQDAGKLTARLEPGVAQVRLALPPLERTLRTLYAVGPDARGSLRAARQATTDLNPLLTRARELMPRIASVSRESARQLSCVRPYTPEIAGLATTWSRFLMYQDGQDKYARAAFPAFPFNQTAQSSAEVAKTFPFLRYAFPAPPGWAVDQPWFNEKCGVGPDTVDVTKDPEIGRSEPGR